MVTTNNSFAAVDISTMFSKSIFTIFVFAIFVMPPGPVSCIGALNTHIVLYIVLYFRRVILRRYYTYLHFYRAKHVVYVGIARYFYGMSSVCLSVCSLMLVDCDHIHWDSREVISRINRVILSLLGDPSIVRKFEGYQVMLSNLGRTRVG